MVLPAIVHRAALFAVLVSSAVAQQLTEGQTLRAVGRYEEAEPWFAAALRDAEKSKADGRSVAVILDNQGLNETHLDHFAAAENAFNRALAILDGSSAEDPALCAIETHLAELYMAEQRPADAEKLLHQALAGLNRGAPADRTALAVAYDDLGTALAMQGRRPEGETLLRRGLTLLEAEYGPDHPMLISSLNPLAALLSVEHHYAEAVAPAERAWHILQSTSLLVAPITWASVLDTLGRAYAHTGRAPEAEVCAHQALEDAEAIFGPAHPWLTPYLTHYADVLALTGHKSEARKIQKRVRTIMALGTHDAGGGATVAVNALH